MILLKCPQCGGSVELDPERTIAHCPFCDFKIYLAQPPDLYSDPPDFKLPSDQQKPDLQTLLALAAEAFADKQYQQACAYYKKAYSQDPGNWIALQIHLCQAHLEPGNWNVLKALKATIRDSQEIYGLPDPELSMKLCQLSHSVSIPNLQTLSNRIEAAGAANSALHQAVFLADLLPYIQPESCGPADYLFYVKHVQILGKIASRECILYDPFCPPSGKRSILDGSPAYKSCHVDLKTRKQAAAVLDQAKEAIQSHHACLGDYAFHQLIRSIAPLAAIPALDWLFWLGTFLLGIILSILMLIHQGLSAMIYLGPAYLCLGCFLALSSARKTLTDQIRTFLQSLILVIQLSWNASYPARPPKT